MANLMEKQMFEFGRFCYLCSLYFLNIKVSLTGYGFIDIYSCPSMCIYDGYSANCYLAV